MKLVTNVETLFLIFMIYAVLGWIMESTLKTIEKHHFVNRGFLIGPYCPIYGYGALIMTIALQSVENVGILFLLATILCSLLEYATSFIMEFLFKARWWDYSRKFGNINGRICLVNSLFFGFGGVLIVKVFNPFLLQFLNFYPSTWILLISCTLIFIFLLDNLVSFSLMSGIRSFAATLKSDNTEEMAAQVDFILKQLTNNVKKEFQKKSILYRRLLNAFPNFQIRKRR